MMMTKQTTGVPGQSWCFISIEH